MKNFNKRLEEKIEYDINDKEQLLNSLSYPQEYLNNPEFITILKIISSLYRDGIIEKSQGWCLGASDMIIKLLNYKGIKARLVECSLTVITENPPSLNFIGYSKMTNGEVGQDSNILDSHIVCVTETTPPFLIDCSCSIQDKTLPFILQELNPTDASSLSEFRTPNSHWMYEYKNDHRIPQLHQQSILDRINTDKSIFDQINFIGKILIFVTLISTVNFARGMFDFHQKYINKNNGFGPGKVQVIK